MPEKKHSAAGGKVIVLRLHIKISKRKKKPAIFMKSAIRSIDGLTTINCGLSGLEDFIGMGNATP